MGLRPGVAAGSASRAALPHRSAPRTEPGRGPLPRGGVLRLETLECLTGHGLGHQGILVGIGLTHASRRLRLPLADGSGARGAAGLRPHPRIVWPRLSGHVPGLRLGLNGPGLRVLPRLNRRPLPGRGLPGSHLGRARLRGGLLSGGGMRPRAVRLPTVRRAVRLPGRLRGELRGLRRPDCGNRCGNGRIGQIGQPLQQLGV